MAPIHYLRRRWSAKHSISAAMLLVLVFIVVTATISISLAPAHLSFFIEKANIAQYAKYKPGKISNTHLNFTMVARNTSPRTAVRYGFMSAEIWYGPAATAWVRTIVDVPPNGWWQQPGGAVLFNISADYGYHPDNNATQDCRVVVESKVWFREWGKGDRHGGRDGCRTEGAAMRRHARRQWSDPAALAGDTDVRKTGPKPCA
ncbi:hypothetical protein BS78_05G114800 [Paspalum vaginatum]|nr:hypothetical protein BS78_05G114800 [Paspalum vaginatum]